jgi:hypothetical protein
MRCAAAAGLVSAVLVFGASTASGASLAASWLRPSGHVLVDRAPKARSAPRSCAAHRWRGVWGAEARILPVACEQPPKSDLLLQIHKASSLALLGW